MQIFRIVSLLDIESSYKSLYKTELKNVVTCLISNYPFTIGNVVFKQGIGIPMGIYHAPF